MLSSMFRVALVVAAVAALGCSGCSQDATSESHASGAAGLLIEADELPNGGETGEQPPEACGPLLVFKENGGAAATTEMFTAGRDVRWAEAAAVFGTPAEAKAAFAELGARKRLECIGQAIVTISGEEAVDVSRMGSRGVGDEDSHVRFASYREGSPQGGVGDPTGYSDAIAIRAGRCTAALLVAADGANPPDPESARITRAAASRLKDRCGK